MKFLSVFVFLIVYPVIGYAETQLAPEYTGSGACKNCHEQEYEKWSDSHHGWAWREPIAANVLGDFNNAEFTHAGFSYRFLTENDEFFIIADNSQGKETKYRLHSVVGVTPLQQYLVDTGEGHLQALDVAWDTIENRWYHLYPEEDTSAGNGMHWSGSYKNWNARCAECHATDYRKNYDPLQHSYSSQQLEIGVGCEACHGPGSAHVAWADAPEKFAPGLWQEVDKQGLTTAYVKNDAASQVNLCAGCHSRREPIGAVSPEPGSDYNDHYRLALLRDGLYFADGQIHDEVYVYGSFLQSKMHDKGVACSNCHDAHSYQLLVQGNAICTQCHNAIGNALFPSLINKDYDTPEHHFHETGTEGAQCKQCHMPERNYMVVDPRRDHSFRIPRPDLSEKLATPNVCNTCHKDKTPAWAVEEISKRYPHGYLNKAHFAEIFHRATSNLDKQTIKQLIELAGDKKMPAIVRASALERLSPAGAGLELDKIEPFLSDENTWVRASAARLATMSDDETKSTKLASLLTDPARSVRLEAIKAYLDGTANKLSFSASVAVNKVMKEYQQSLADKADFPEVQMALGGVALTRRNAPAAISAFERAVTMDPQLVQAWIMLARIYAAVGQADQVRHTLTQAINANPEDETLRQLGNSF